MKAFWKPSSVQRRTQKTCLCVNIWICGLVTSQNKIFKRNQAAPLNRTKGNRRWLNTGLMSERLLQRRADVVFKKSHTRLFSASVPTIEVTHYMLIQWCFNVGPASQTLGQHLNIIVSTCRVCWAANSGRVCVTLHQRPLAQRQPAVYYLLEAVMIDENISEQKSQ